MHAPTPCPAIVSVQIIAADPLLRGRLRELVDGEPGFAVVDACASDAAQEACRRHRPRLVVAWAASERELSELFELAQAEAEPLFAAFLPPARLWWSAGAAREAAESGDLTALVTQLAALAARAFAALPLVADHGPDLRLGTLTAREREILRMTAEGLSIKEIARTLGRQFSTVAKHRDNLMKKLSLHDKVSLTRFAIRAGLVRA